jgi:uncharacterized protein YcfL
MKKALVLVLALFLLTGCTSSPSREDQARLIEYQACLEKQEKIQQEVRQLITKNGYDLEQTLKTIFSTGKTDVTTGLITSLETMKKNCAEYRPK